MSISHDDFDPQQLRRIARAHAVDGRVYTDAILTDPEIATDFDVAHMSKRERYAFRRTGGKVLSVFRADVGLRWRNFGRHGTGSEWDVILSLEEPEDKLEEPEDKLAEA